MSVPILQSRVFYGLKTDVAGNAHYISDNDVLYPVGNAIAIHNFNQKRQKLLNLSDKSDINIIAIAPNKKHVALCETGDKPTISIYDLQSLRRRKALGIPYDCPGVKKFTCLSFSFDSKYIAAVTDQPDQTMLFYAWEKGKIESSIKVQNSGNLMSIVDQISCNPGEIGIVALAGPYTFKFLTVSETIWRPYGFAKAENLIITSITWLNTDRLLAGTRDGRILFLENGDLKNIYKMSETNLINFKVREEFVIAPTASQTALNDAEILENEIRSLISFPKGFVFGHGPGKIIVFEKDGAHKFIKKSIFQIPIQASKNSEMNLNYYQINSISVNTSSDRIVVTSGWAQIFTEKIWNDSVYPDQTPQDLKVLGQPLHHGKINSLSMCAWKSIFMTSGSDDRSVRIWDFESENLVMLKHYQEEIFSVALHPNGLFCLIGFSDKLRFMTILIDDLRTMQEFSIRNCQIVSFSHGGHLFSAVNGNVIQIYTTMGFVNKFLLRGHTGKIKTTVWSNSDMKFISIGTEGAIYTWDMSSGLRIDEIILKGVSLNGATILSDNETIICIASDKKIREIRGDSVVRLLDIENTELGTLLVGKNDSLTFITSPGGVILSLKSPLQEPIEFKSFHIHSTDISNISFSFNEQILISAGIDGSLCFWKIISSETTLESRDFGYTNEVLIGKYELEEKIQTIGDLNVRMIELDSENSYKIRQIEVQHTEKMREIHQIYTEAIEELKCKIEILHEEKAIELNNINAEITQLKSEHQKIIKDMEISYDNRLIVEYDKYSDFEKLNNKMREDYESKLSELNKNWEKQLDDMKKRLEAIIYEKNLQIQESQEEMVHQIELHEVIKSQIEDDADREIMEIRTNYEAQLYDEKQSNLKLKGEAGVLRNKYISSQREIDDLRRQVEHLKTERKIFQKTIQDFEKDIVDLKNEINERDLTIQDKEKKIYELKRNNQELEKYKVVLNYKIQELKNVIEPKDDEIKELKEKISDMEIELMNYQKRNEDLELKLNDAKEKMIGARKEANLETMRNKSAQILIGKMRKDLANVAAIIQDPNLLKTEVRKLYHRYSDEKEFLREKEADTEAYCEFLRQRDQLERTVASLQKQETRKMIKGVS